MDARRSLRLFAPLSSAVVVFLAVGLIGAQTVPRAPVIPVKRPGAEPTPTPVPDPTGVYSGNASVHVQGFAPFTQTLEFPVQVRPCPDCDPGQYYFHSTAFDGLVYQGGDVECGEVFGFVNPTGRVIDPYFTVVNCPFINPSDVRDTARDPAARSYRGLYFGGSFGPAEGTVLTLRNGILSGRISGRDCFGRLLTTDVNLIRTSNVVQSCSTRISGSYGGTFANSCGGAGSGSISLAQAGCFFSGLAYDDFSTPATAVEGEIASPTTATVRLKFLSPCQGSGTGTATIQSNGLITGSYTGTSVCCPGTFNGAFTLTP